MSSNFYDDGGWMVGLDRHIFMKGGPGWLQIVGIPTKVWHFVVSPHNRLAATSSKRCATVTSEGDKMIKEGFTLYLIPHVPLTLDAPAVSEVPTLASIIATSKSTAVMSAHSVTSEKTPLAVCLRECVGANPNCGSPGVGVVLNPNSVKTSPTLGDYASAAVGIGLGAFLGGVATGLIPNPILRFLVNKYLVSKYVVLPLRRLVQRTVDGHQ